MEAWSQKEAGRIYGINRKGLSVRDRLPWDLVSYGERETDGDPQNSHKIPTTFLRRAVPSVFPVQGIDGGGSGRGSKQA